MERQSTAFILRLYFAAVSTVTLFTVMFAAVDLLQIGLKTFVIKSADQPEWMENCATATQNRPIVAEGEKELTDEEIVAQCETRNDATIENYQRTKASNAVRSLSLIIIAAPLFGIHFRTLYRDWMAMHKE